MNLRRITACNPLSIPASDARHAFIRRHTSRRTGRFSGGSLCESCSPGRAAGSSMPCFSGAEFWSLLWKNGAPPAQHGNLKINSGFCDLPPAPPIVPQQRPILKSGIRNQPLSILTGLISLRLYQAKPIRSSTVRGSRLRFPYFDSPRERGLWSTGISVIRRPARAKYAGMNL